MEHEKTNLQDDRPPVLGSWRNMYFLVLGALAIQIVIYSAITWYFK